MPTFDHDDATLFYTSEGEGPAVILLTGFAVGGGVWEYQVPALSGRYRVICLDNRGAGRTRAPSKAWSMSELAGDVLALMDHLGLEQAHLVGCSMGGMVAQEVALMARERWLSLTLIATHAGRLVDRLPRPTTVVGFLRSNLGPKEVRRRAVEGLLFPATYLANGPRDRIDHALERDFLVQPPWPDRLGQLAAILKHDTSRRLSALAGLPTLVIVAGQDVLLPPSGCAALARLIPGAEKVVLAEAGHGVIGQCPDEVNAALLAHLEAARPRAGSASASA